MKRYRIGLLVLVQIICLGKPAFAQLATGSWDATYSALYFNTNNSVENIVIVANKTASKLFFRIGATDKATLTGAGYFGIGTNTPSSLLHVQSTLSGTSGNDFRLANLAASNGDYLRMGSGFYNSANIEINAFAVSGTKHLVLQGDNNAGNTGIGSFIGGAAYYGSVNSKLHLQGGNVQIINSGASPLLTDNTKYGLTMGYSGSIAKVATDYSWFQSSNGPLVLNPRSPNTLISTGNSTSYVAIGYIPDGTAVAPGYNLLVQGKVLCEELKIKLKPSAGTAWPDYVFSPNYKLLSVDSLQSYITTNGHLPEIPSAKEVEENGIMAGEMNGLLLKKVEELTLYMLEQNKTSTVQAEQIELLKKQNELLVKQIEALISKSK